MVFEPLVAVGVQALGKQLDGLQLAPLPANGYAFDLGYGGILGEGLIVNPPASD
jgi:hypothetical protein